MVLIPLGTFYFSFYVIFQKSQAMLGVCGILAVIAANLVIAAYVVMAWNEDDADMKRENQNAQARIKTD